MFGGWFAQNAPNIGGSNAPKAGSGGGFLGALAQGAGVVPGQDEGMPIGQGPQMQPGGSGFEEQQPGAVPLPNTGAIGPTGGPLGGLMSAGQVAPQRGYGGLFGQFLNQVPAVAALGGTPQPAGGGGGLFGGLGGAMSGMGGWAGNMARGGGMMGNVLLRAPDGSTKSVPAGEMSHWLGRGAVRF